MSDGTQKVYTFTSSRIDWSLNFRSKTWAFTTRDAADLARIRMSGNPEMAIGQVQETTLRTEAPKANTGSAAIDIKGAVSPAAGPFYDGAENPSQRLKMIGWSLIYSGPADSEEQAQRDAQALHTRLVKANLWPESKAELDRILSGYHGLPWWLERPPYEPKPGRTLALHGILVCPDCSRFLEEGPGDQDIYVCPGGESGENPDCRCKNVPAQEAGKRIITSLLERTVDYETQNRAARDIQGNSTDPEYHRTLAGEALQRDTKREEKRRRLEEDHEGLFALTQGERNDRERVRTALGECVQDGNDPLAALSQLKWQANRRMGMKIERAIHDYLEMLLERNDSKGARKWLRSRVRCAEAVPEGEAIHYVGSPTKYDTKTRAPKHAPIWERADQTYRVEQMMTRNGE